MLGIIDSGTSICENDSGKHTSLDKHRFWNTEFRMPTLANTNSEQTSLHNLPQINPTQPQSAMIGARIVTFSLFPIMRITMAFSPRHIWFYLTVYMSRLADPELKGYVCIVALLIASSTWCLATCGPTRWQFNRGLRCQNPCRSAHRRGGGERCQQPPFGCDWSEKNCEGNSKTSAKARLKAFWVVAGILEASATPEEACEQSVCPMLPLTSHMRSSWSGKIVDPGTIRTGRRNVWVAREDAVSMRWCFFWTLAVVDQLQKAAVEARVRIWALIHWMINSCSPKKICKALGTYGFCFNLDLWGESRCCRMKIRVLLVHSSTTWCCRMKLRIGDVGMFIVLSERAPKGNKKVNNLRKWCFDVFLAKIDFEQ